MNITTTTSSTTKNDYPLNSSNDDDNLFFEPAKNEPTTPIPSRHNVIDISPKNKTPQKIQGAVDTIRSITKDQLNIDSSNLGKKDMGNLERAIEIVKTDTPAGVRSNLVRKLATEFINELPLTEGAILSTEPKPKRHCVGTSQNNIVTSLEDSWQLDHLKTLKKLHRESVQLGEKEIPWIVNQTHITEMGENGFHLCSAQQKPHVTVLLEEPRTGIWFGTFKKSDQKEKASTFFPKDVSFQDLLNLLSTANVMAEGGARKILDLPGKAYKVEALYKHDTVWSCYPVWYFAHYADKATFNVFHNKEYTAPEIKKAIEEARKENTIYDLRGSVIIDIASKLPNSPIDRGIYIVDKP